jgi:predicted restriction endonuclease
MNLTIKRKPKSPLKKLQDRLLDLWRIKVKERAGYRCEICGKSNCKLDPHHIITRKNLTTKWDLHNGVCLCCGCHTLKGRLSAHGDPLFFTAWLLEHRPEDYEYLRVKKNERFDRDYIRIEAELKEIEIKII